MIIFNNQEFKTFKELQEKLHLVTERHIRLVCHCRTSFTEKIIKENSIMKYPVIANGKECFVYNEAIIDLIHKIKPIKNDPIPDSYIPQTELLKHLGITRRTLSDLEFWCWDFKKYKKFINNRIYFDFSEEAQDFYKRKLYKWRNPDRKHGTCWQR